MSNELKSLKTPNPSEIYEPKEKSDITISETNNQEKKKYINYLLKIFFFKFRKKNVF